MNETIIESLPPRTDRNWIQTFTGRQFWPLNPRPEDVCIEDIAHALALKCRYTGHCRRFYSVAEHSVRASYLVKPEFALLALMHDATEAYMPDVAAPIKREMPILREMEDRIWGAICAALNLPGEQMPADIKKVDLILLATERRDLLSPPPIPWISIENVTPDFETIHPRGCIVAEEWFLSRWYDLRAAAEAARGETAKS
jgi:hypothetical protein